jgi:hypothetical protein
VLDGIMDREDRWVTARERKQSRVVILVDVHDLRLPRTERSPYLEQHRDRGGGSDPTGDNEQEDSLAPQSIKYEVPF